MDIQVPSRSSGFSLLEVIVSLGVVAILTASSAALFRLVLDDSFLEMQNQARTIFEKSRTLALSSGSLVSLSISEESFLLVDKAGSAIWQEKSVCESRVEIEPEGLDVNRLPLKTTIFWSCKGRQGGLSMTGSGVIE